MAGHDNDDSGTRSPSPTSDRLPSGGWTVGPQDELDEAALQNDPEVDAFLNPAQPGGPSPLGVVVPVGGAPADPALLDEFEMPSRLGEQNERTMQTSVVRERSLDDADIQAMEARLGSGPTEPPGRSRYSSTTQAAPAAWMMRATGGFRGIDDQAPSQQSSAGSEQEQSLPYVDVDAALVQPDALPAPPTVPRPDESSTSDGWPVAGDVDAAPDSAALPNEGWTDAVPIVDDGGFDDDPGQMLIAGAMDAAQERAEPQDVSALVDLQPLDAEPLDAPTLDAEPLAGNNEPGRADAPLADESPADQRLPTPSPVDFEDGESGDTAVDVQPLRESVDAGRADDVTPDTRDEETAEALLVGDEADPAANEALDERADAVPADAAPADAVPADAAPADAVPADAAPADAVPAEDIEAPPAFAHPFTSAAEQEDAASVDNAAASLSIDSASAARSGEHDLSTNELQLMPAAPPAIPADASADHEAVTEAPDPDANAADATPDASGPAAAPSVEPAQGASVEERDATPALASEEAAAAESGRRRQHTPFGLEVAPPTITPLELEGGLPSGEFHWLNQFDMFRAEVQRLARAKRWRRVAAITGHALLHAPYSSGGTRTAMLLDLARIYRDRLKDGERAEEAFAAVTRDEPENAEALAYLEERYASRGDDRALYELLFRAVESTWDPQDRLTWTRRCAALAIDRLNDPVLATRAWEQLWRLGDAEGESALELARYYRISRAWSELGGFLRQRADALDGSDAWVVRRELAEILRVGEGEGAAAAEVLEAVRAERPEDPVVFGQLCEIYAALGSWPRLSALAPAGADLARRHAVAGTLWEAGRHDEAAHHYRAILDEEGSDALALDRVEAWLRESKRYEALVDALVARASQTRDEDERIALLSEAAEVADAHLNQAERATALLLQRVEIEGETLPVLERLCALYRKTEAHEALASALDARLERSEDPEADVPLLRELARHAALALDDDQRAEEAWRRLLERAPADTQAYEALVEIYRVRGDHSALVATLEAQLSRTTQRDAAVVLCRAIAEHVDAHFDDPVRAVETWQRVLDDAPSDRDALAALARHAAAAGDRPGQIAALERRIRWDEGEARSARMIQIAELWEAEGELRYAASAFERALHSSPASTEALDGLVRVYVADERADLAVDALDHAMSASASRAELLERTLELLPAQAHKERFERRRRIVLLQGDASQLDALEADAEAAGSWIAFVAVLEHLASLAEGDDRSALVERVAATLESRLEAADRAWAVRAARLLRPDAAERALDGLRDASMATARHEDWMAMLDELSHGEFAHETRIERLVERAERCVLLDAPLRTFEAWRRVLALDAHHESAHAALAALAEEHDLWVELDAALVAVSDVDEREGRRLAFARERAALASAGLASPRLAFGELLRAFRIVPDGEHDELDAAAGALDAWPTLLASREAAAMASFADDLSNVAAVRDVAAAWVERVDDQRHALDLATLAMELVPDDPALGDMVLTLADSTGRHDAAARTFRRAAAATDDAERRLTLLRKTAALLEGPLQDPSAAVDVHRRILELDPDNMRSLDVVLEDHREHERWEALRASLQHSVALELDEEERRSRWVEIATLSETQLNDVVTALHVYGRLLEEQPDHTLAHARMEALVAELDDPALRLRFLAMEREMGDDDRKVEVDIEMAKIHAERLGDADAAIVTLEASLAEFGPSSASVDLLDGLYEAHARWSKRGELAQARAEAASEKGEKLAHLRRALDAVERCDPPADVAELYTAILSLDPSDRRVRRAQAQQLRLRGDDQALFDALGALAEHVVDPDERSALDRERARLLHRNLDDAERARTAWQSIAEAHPQDEAPIAALATIALEAGDLDAYLEHRRALARTLPKEHGALVLCHLAEMCEEAGDRRDDMVAFYREARQLHASCTPAMEALKAIGRRRKDLRPEAALLPEAGERALTRSERAARLVARAEAVAAEDAAQEVEWLLRAVATDLNDVEAWDALARAWSRAGDEDAAYRARLEALEALRRRTPLRPENVGEEAERLLVLAQLARGEGGDEAFDRLVRRVHQLAPGHVPTALVVAERDVERGRPEDAYALTHRLLIHDAGRLSAEESASLLALRARASVALDDTEAARADLRAAIDHAPLFGRALADLCALSEPVEAIPCLVRAVAVEVTRERRAEWLFDLGVLWEDGVGTEAAKREAGACYELARAEGLDTRALLHRIFRHFQRTGALSEGLDVVDTLLESADDASELATLWVARGEIFAAHEGREDDAIEAFDMALSYDPDCDPARAALAEVLQRRGEWDQALQILEAVAESEGVDRAAVLTQMAEIAQAHTDERARAEAWLREAVEMDSESASKALDALLALVGERDPGGEEHRALIGRLVAGGAPYFDRLEALGRLAMATQPALAWCLLSPALVIRGSDDDLKSTLRDMRRDHERPPLRVLPAEGRGWASEELEAIANVLTAWDSSAPFGRTALTDVADETHGVSVHSSIGRTFQRAAEAWGVAGATMLRADGIDEAVRVVPAPGAPNVLVRSDVFQQMARAEIGFVLTYGLAMAQPDTRGVASLPAEQRASVIAGLWLACGFVDEAGVRATHFAERIRSTIDADTLLAWSSTLEPFAESDPVALGRRYWAAAEQRALRAGLVAGADLFQAVRLIARARPEIERPGVFADDAAFDAYVAADEAMRTLVETAADPRFAGWLDEAAQLES